MATQKQIAQNMIDQLRALDASISADVGTPERRIIDVVAQAITDAQIDLNVLQGAFDIESKFGDDLDSMLSILGFGRQIGAKSTGYVTFSRDTATTNSIIISSGTTVYAPSAGDNNVSIVFRTTTTVTMLPGTTEVIAPIEAVQPGTIGNVAANTITATVGSPIYGITGVNNPYPTQGGLDRETDSELKARFTTAGPFRNLAGTKDQFLAAALATKSKKANVIGPVSKYTEYVQVPEYSDAEEGGNGPADAVYQFTTSLSSNTNAKHVYDNLSHFVVNDSGISPIYYNKDYDYTLNVNPIDKNFGDAARNAQFIDPLSAELPTIYQPNLTFNNVYIGNIGSRPENSIAPGDVLLFEYSYLSSASRNNFVNGVTNCIDIYVNGSDAKIANTVIPRPGNSVPTFTFIDNDSSNAFYVNNYRRINEPGHRPIAGNIFTPLYHQPVINLPDQINLSDGTFIKNVHYWLVEEITDLYGTIRARNGIEWSTTIPSKKSSDPQDGPYTGPYINTDTVSLAQLKIALPSSVNNSTTTITPDAVDNVTAFNVVKKQVVTTSQSKVFTSTPHDLNQGDTVVISDTDVTVDGTFVISPVSGGGSATGTQSIGGVTYYWININKANTTTDASPVNISPNGKLKLTKIGPTSQTGIKVNSSEPFPNSGYIQLNSEIIRYSSKAGNVFTIAERGCFNTNRNEINLTGANTVNVLIEIKSNTTDAFPTNDYVLIDNEQIQYSLPVGDIKTLLKIEKRGANGSYTSSHSANADVYLLFTAIDPTVQITGYQYDENIMTLQALLEENKQVTTDVLAHRAKVRYFKPDITVMYSSGVNKNIVNQSIKNSLTSYFDSLYFGNTIQLSDVLQTIHNTPGVDNVRWSKDSLSDNSSLYDLDQDARTRITETNQYGDPISQPILDLTKIGNGLYATEYKFYLPYLQTQTTSAVEPPTNLTATLADASGSLSNTTYYYAVTAFNDNGETSIKSIDGTLQTASVTVTSNKNANLTWTGVNEARGYRIYRNTSNVWTGGSLLLAELDQDQLSYVDDGTKNPTGQVPPVTNQALLSTDETVAVSNFELQYGNNEPVVIEYDDFIVQIYDEERSYSKNDVVKYGNTFYRSLIDENVGIEPSSNVSNWAVDTINKIGFTSKVNFYGNVITASNAKDFVYAPSFDNPITITFINANDRNTLSIIDTNLNSGYGAFNTDFQIGDGELASLPIGNSENDIQSIMTIRIKAQNTWNSTL